MDLLPKRKRNRLKHFDYSQNSAYHIIICVRDKAPILSSIAADDITDDRTVELTQIGKIVDKYINEIPKHYEHVSVADYVIMPNHIHLMLLVENPETLSGGRQVVAPTDA